MEETSLMRNRGGEIMEEESWRRNYGGIMSVNWCGTSRRPCRFINDVAWQQKDQQNDSSSMIPHQ